MTDGEVGPAADADDPRALVVRPRAHLPGSVGANGAKEEPIVAPDGFHDNVIAVLENVRFGAPGGGAGSPDDGATAVQEPQVGPGHPVRKSEDDAIADHLFPTEIALVRAVEDARQRTVRALDEGCIEPEHFEGGAFPHDLDGPTGAVENGGGQPILAHLHGPDVRSGGEIDLEKLEVVPAVRRAGTIEEPRFDSDG